MNRSMSLNHRAAWRLVFLALLSGIVIISAFYAVERGQIRDRAVQTLTDFTASPWSAYDEVAPEIYAISTEDLGDDTLSELEYDLLNYYVTHEEALSLEEVHSFSNGDQAAYFFPRAVGKVGEATDGVLLIYTDVSFAVSIVRFAVLTMAAVFLCVAVLLYLAGRHTIRLLDQKDQSMRNFFANASHELKTPLVAIRGYAEGLKDGIVSQKKACGVISKEAERMTDLINSILEFSKLDGGILQPHIAENDVREILYDAIQTLEPAAARQGAELCFDLPDPLLFPCDEELLISVFTNIMTNSIRYARSSIMITASVHGNPDYLRVSIENDGPPVSGQDAARMFERFYKGAGGQSGIGMALSREYMQLMGGDITVSVHGGRTKFEVILRAAAGSRPPVNHRKKSGS